MCGVCAVSEREKEGSGDFHFVVVINHSKLKAFHCVVIILSFARLWR